MQVTGFAPGDKIVDVNAKLKPTEDLSAAVHKEDGAVKMLRKMKSIHPKVKNRRVHRWGDLQSCQVIQLSELQFHQWQRQNPV